MSLTVKPSSNTDLLDVTFNSDGDMVNSNGEYVDDTWSVSAANAQDDTAADNSDSSDDSSDSSDDSSDSLTTTITVTHQTTLMTPTTPTSLITVMTPTIQTTLNTNTYLLPVQAHHLFRKLREKEITNLRKCRIKFHLCIRAYRRLRKFVEVLKDKILCCIK